MDLPRTLPLTREDLRIFLRDFAGNNILLDNVQFTTDELSRAIEFAAEEFNIFAPITNIPMMQVPRSILMIGAASWLMQSESFLQLRNEAHYSDGDVQNIGVDDKAAAYISLSRELRDRWQTTAQRYKVQLNCESAWGSLSSGYRYSGRFSNN